MIGRHSVPFTGTPTPKQARRRRLRRHVALHTHPWQTMRSYCTVPEARAIHPSLRTLRALRGAPRHSLSLRRTSILLPNSTEGGELRFERKLAGWDGARVYLTCAALAPLLRVWRGAPAPLMYKPPSMGAPPTSHLGKNLHFSLAQSGHFQTLMRLTCRPLAPDPTGSSWSLSVIPLATPLPWL